MIIFGGAGTLVGPVIGAFFVTYVKNIVSTVTERWTLILGLLFVLMVIAAPSGVVGPLEKRMVQVQDEKVPVLQVAACLRTTAACRS